MKWPGVLALACAPLAIATAAAFVSMGRAWVGPGGDDAPAAAQSAQRAVEAAKAVVASDKEQRAAAALEDGDLLEGRGVGQPAAIPVASVAAPVQASLEAWESARSVAWTLLRLDRAIRSGDPATLAATRAELTAMRESLAVAGPPGRESCQAALDDLSRRLDQRLAVAKQQAEADALYRSAATMLAEGRSEEALAALRRCLDLYGSAMDAPVAASVRNLARRAEFQVAVRRSRADLADAATSAQQIAVLSSFLARFGSDRSWTEAEQAILAQCRRRLDALRASMRADETRRSAQESLAALDAALPGAFDQRLSALARIVQKHPELNIDAEVRRRLRAWLEEAVPVKQADEDGRLEEAVATTQEILRGYFQEVTLADGTRGYKRFDTAAQRDRPTSDVGTLRRDQLARPPGPSLPQRSVQRYDDVRRKALADPSGREIWLEMAGACDALESELTLYRKRPGAGGAGLAFAAEARFARQLAAPEAWKLFDELWRGRARP